MSTHAVRSQPTSSSPAGNSSRKRVCNPNRRHSANPQVDAPKLPHAFHAHAAHVHLPPRRRRGRRLAQLQLLCGRRAAVEQRLQIMPPARCAQRRAVEFAQPRDHLVAWPACRAHRLLPRSNTRKSPREHDGVGASETPRHYPPIALGQQGGVRDYIAVATVSRFPLRGKRAADQNEKRRFP